MRSLMIVTEDQVMKEKFRDCGTIWSALDNNWFEILLSGSLGDKTGEWFQLKYVSACECMYTLIYECITINQ